MGKRYTDIDNSYLDQAIQRILSGLETVSNLPVLLGPPSEDREKTLGSYWALGASLMSVEDIASDVHLQTWSVASALVYKPNQQAYDATIYSSMHVLVPRTFNYMQAHKRLVFASDQDPVRYLQDDLVQVVLNSLNQNGQPGFSIVHRLPFRLMFQQE